MNINRLNQKYFILPTASEVQYLKSFGIGRASLFQSYFLTVNLLSFSKDSNVSRFIFEENEKNNDICILKTSVDDHRRNTARDY